MSGPATDAQLLRGKTVAFTGRLASMTRSRAAELVRAYGGNWAATVTRRTSILVVGQEGWPLRRDGRLSVKLRAAHKLRHAHRVEVITEADLLARLGLETTPWQRLSTAQLSELLKVPGERIRGWVDLGLMRPTETVHGVHYFDFRQASWARSLCNFLKVGVTPSRIRHSLEQLRRWLPGVDEPLAQLSILEENGQLLVRQEQGRLFEPTGQGLFDFDEAATAGTVEVNPSCGSAEEWFESGCEHEDSGQLREAARAYRQALLVGGPEKRATFNLANVLYALGHKAQAAERFRQALELDQDFVDAWNNLGNVLAELGEADEAVEALEKALELDPEYGDAHYNLADVLDSQGRKEQAAEHWRSYLRQQPVGPWSDHARRRLRMDRA
jgi:tetratricopeptide (TPR) repeat protein